MAESNFLEYLRFANPQGCCLPSPPSHLNYEEAVKQLLQTPSPTKTSDLRSSKSDDTDVGIQELIDDNQLGFLGREKMRPKTVQVEPKLRAQCIDYLIDAAEKLYCAPSTLHLAVNYLDRYLSTNQFDYLDRYLSGHAVEIEDLRFVGLTCLMIASKYDGIQEQFQFDAYLGLCRSVASRHDLIRMENRILSCLGYEMTAVTTWSFLERFVAQSGRSEASLASYFAEVSLLSASMLPFLPSLVAASSVFLAQYVLEPSKRPWSEDLRRRTMYRRSDLLDCVFTLHDCCYGSESYYLPAITIKYSKKKHDYVALINYPPYIPLHIFED